jgi:serine/threonine protein kinase
MAQNDPLIDQRLGDYQIIEILGRGGMARVYKGYDEQLDRYAAVKVIDASLLNTENEDEYRQRFQREARAIAKLRHPSIVGVYQFGEFESLYYMAMVFIEGQDLGQILKATAGVGLSNGQVLRIVHDIAGALDYAHSGGVIHRDVKPSNIMVTNDNHAILTDFGLALSVPEGSIGNTFGSAHYIAPEQAISSADAIPQSDMYGLGVVLYQMLTGKVPFDDPSAMSVALKHLSDPPPPLRYFNPNISPQVETVVLKSLEKDPKDRYRNGEEFARALEKAMGISTVSSQYLPPLPGKLTTSEMKKAQPGETGTILFPDSDPDSADIEIDKSTNKSSTEARKAISQESRAVQERRSTQEILAANSASQASISKPIFTEESTQQPQKRGLIGIVAVVALVAVVAIVLLALGQGNNGSASANGTGTSPAPTELAAIATDEATPIESATLEDTPEPTTAAPTEARETPETPSPTDTDAPTATDTDAAATDAPTRRPTTDVPTADALSIDATATPRRSLTRPPTETPPNTPTPTPTANAAASATAETLPIVLRWDDETLVLFNRGGRVEDIGGISFVQPLENGGSLTFFSDTWDGGTRPVYSLPGNDCFQVWKLGAQELPEPPYCNIRHAWRAVASPRWFWVSNDSAATFQVRRGETVLAICLISTGECAFNPSADAGG